MTQSSSPPPPAPPDDTVTLTIDGRSATVPKSTLLVEAAKTVGIDVPVFCYHEKLKSVGACRMCLVEIEKMRGLQTACTTPVAADMVAHTKSKDAIAAQNGVIEFLLENHPLDCPVCDKGGECPLQDNTFAHGRGVSRFTEQKRHMEKAYPLSDLIVLDRERCIMCYRCVRFHQEIPGDEALAAVNRGTMTMIGTLPGEEYDSIFSGNTIELCPVGALTSRQYRFKARPWDLVRTPSVCNGCAVGCNVEVHSRVERVLRLVTRENPAVDGGWLCDAGRFGTLPALPEDRPSRPLLRDSAGALHPVPWSEALARAGELLRSSGALVASPALSNETLWLLDQYVRPRLAGAALWPQVSPVWPVEGAIAHLLDCKTIILAGLDVWQDLPILALWIRRAVERQAKLVVIGPANGLHRDTAHWLRVGLGQEAETAQALLAALRAATPPDNVAATDVERAAAVLRADGAGPAVLLVHPSLVMDAAARGFFQELAREIGATAVSGLVGAPALAANARGAQGLTPDLAASAPQTLLERGMQGHLSGLLLFGDEPWSNLNSGTTPRIVVSSQPLQDDPRVEIVLPMAHPYERQGTITNLEGRIQFQEGGASPPGHARTDWGIAGDLAVALDAPAPTGLMAIRESIAQHNPDWAAIAGAEPLLARD